MIREMKTIRTFAVGIGLCVGVFAGPLVPMAGAAEKAAIASTAAPADKTATASTATPADKTATASTATPADKAATASTEVKGFPLVIKGTELFITRDTKREPLLTQLQGIIKAEPSVKSAERDQFDFQASDEAPLTLAIDWDEKGAISLISLDAFSETQNPVAKGLKEWLTKTVGAGKLDKKDNSQTWVYQGWELLFNEGGDGEDSHYSFTISPKGK